MGIPASQRVRKQSEFQKVRRSALRVQCGPFIVQCDPGPQAGTSPPKLGVIASRRVGNAVKRNRGKRLIREIFRRRASNLPENLMRGSRFVVVLRAGYTRYKFAELEKQFMGACAKIAKRTDAEESLA